MHWTREALSQAAGVPIPSLGGRPLPIYLRVILGGAGWVASLFFLFWIGLCFFSGPDLWLPLGGVLLVAATGIGFLPAAGPLSDGIEQTGLVTGLVGRMLAFAGLANLLDSVERASLIMAAVELVLVVVMRQPVSRVYSTFAVPSLLLFATGAFESKLVLQVFGVVVTLVAFALVALRHPLEAVSARLDATLSGGWAGPTRHFTGMATTTGLALAVWAMGLEVLGNDGWAPAWGLYGFGHGVVCALIILYYAREHRLGGRSLLAACIGAVAVVVIGTRVAGLPLAVGFGLVAMRTRNTWLAVAALGFTAVYLGIFYYALSSTLIVKGLFLVGTGLLFLALRRLIARHDEVPTVEGSTSVLARVGMVGALGVTLGAVLAQVAWVETSLGRSEQVYLALAPRDPRSLVQGDYMVLNYALGDQAELFASEHDTVLATLDGSKRIVGLAPADHEPGPDERVVRLSGWSGEPLATESYLFQEGMRPVFQPARFGRFALGPDGRLRLLGLSDADLKPLGGRSRRW